MKNITKEILYTLAASALVVSCAKDVVVDDPGQTDGSGYVTFVSEITRAGETSFDDNDEISVTAYNEGVATKENILYTYDGSLFTSETPIAKSTSAERSYLAVYPYLEVPSDNKFSFEVQTDQSEGNTLSDLMWSTVAATAAESPTLTFNRLMSKITVSVKDSDLDLNEADVTLFAKVGADVDLSDTTASVTATDANVTSIAMASEITSATEAKYSAIVVPQTIEAGATIATITVAGTIHTLSLDEANTLAVGKSYELEVTIVSGTVEVIFSESINGWNDGDWGNSVEFTTEETQTLSADNKAATLDLNDIIKITGSDVSIIWESSDDDIVTVEDGILTAVAGGEATIKISVEGGSTYDEINVVVTESVASFTLSSSSLVLGDTHTSTLAVTSFLPSTVYPVIDDMTELELTWSSDDTNIATVEDGVVTGVSYGSTIIRAKTAEGVESTCSVEVQAIVLGTYYTSDMTFSNDSTTANIIGIVYAIKDETAMVMDIYMPYETSSFISWGPHTAAILPPTEANLCGRTNMNVVLALDETLATYPAFYKAAAYNTNGVPEAYTADMLNTWYLGSVYEMCELYVGYSGLEMVASHDSSLTGVTGYTGFDEASGTVSYDQWIYGQSMLKSTNTTTGEYAFAPSTGTYMPGSKEVAQMNARLSFNEKITAANGVTLYNQADGFNGATNSAGTAVGNRTYWTSNDLKRSGNSNYWGIVMLMSNSSLNDAGYGNLTYCQKNTAAENQQVRAIMEVALPIATNID